MEEKTAPKYVIADVAKDSASLALPFQLQIVYSHRESFGARQRIEMLEVRTNRQSVPADLSMKLVAQHLGYLDSKGRPTALASRLKAGRNDLIQIVEEKVFPAPGKVLSSADPRFQAILFPPETDEDEVTPG